MITDLPDDDRRAWRDAARDELALTNLAAFVRQAWRVIEPERPLVWNWHLTLICNELERVSRGECDELVICVPPGTGKSMVVSAIWPAWLWLRQPALRVLAIAHIPKLATRDSIRMRDLVSSRWYRDRVEVLAEREGIGLVENSDGERKPWALSADQNEKINFVNTAKGGREVGSVRGGITGVRVEGLIIDDPYNARDVLVGSPGQVNARMEEVVTLYEGSWRSRVEPIGGWRVTIMQRLHDHDLAGELIRRGVRAVVLPFTADPAAADRHPRDPRKAGELIFPRRFSAEWYGKLRSAKGGAAIADAQYEQRPRAGVGRLFQRAWFQQRYSGEPVRFARTMEDQAITVDCTFRDTKDSDMVVMQVWGRREARKYLLHQIRDRMDLPATIHALIDLAAAWPRARLKLIETKANGDGVVQLLRGRIPGLVGYDPRASKYARAQVAALAYEAQEVYLPEPEHAPWVGEFVAEHIDFTGEDGGKDDQVDAESQLFIRWDGAEGVDAGQRTRAQFGFMGGRRPA